MFCVFLCEMSHNPLAGFLGHAHEKRTEVISRQSGLIREVLPLGANIDVARHKRRSLLALVDLDLDAISVHTK